jgi:hypothetical protein
VDGWGQTAAEALVDLRRGLEDRINKGDPAFGKGRKWEWEYQIETTRAARELLLDPRLLFHPRIFERRSHFLCRLLTDRR